MRDARARLLARIDGTADLIRASSGLGASLLAMGVLTALLERARTGQGLHVEVSMLRAALDLEMEVATYVLNGAPAEKTATPLASMFHPPPYAAGRRRWPASTARRSCASAGMTRTPSGGSATSASCDAA